MVQALCPPDCTRSGATLNPLGTCLRPGSGMTAGWKTGGLLGILQHTDALALDLRSQKPAGDLDQLLPLRLFDAECSRLKQLAQDLGHACQHSQSGTAGLHAFAYVSIPSVFSFVGEED